MDKNLFYCKRDVWWNIVYDDFERMQLKDSLSSISQQLSFVKAHEKSILVFEKGKTYKREYISSDVMYSELEKHDFIFVYNTNEKYIYFHSVFLPIKFERKLKIKKFLRENK
jgi:hypothetical protein